jgi:hypothetical protein
MTAPRSSQGGIRTGAEVTAQTTRRSCRGVTHPDGSGTYALEPAAPVAASPPVPQHPLPVREPWMK